MTTPVGSIRVDMSIDGSDMWGEVAAQIAPVIAGLEGLEDRLNRVQSQYRRTGSESTRSADQQTAALNRAARAADGLADKYSRVAAQAVSASGLAEAAVDQVTRAWQRQTAAIAANTAARAANAATPTGGSGGGGGGGGGAGAGAHAGGFMRGGKGRYGFVTSPVGLNLGALTAAGLPAAATAVTNLTGAVQQLIQLGAVAPAVYAAIGSSAGVAALGLSGVGDAVKSLSESMKDGATADQLLKAKEALEELHPEAAAVATSLAKINVGPLKDLKKHLGGNLLAGVAPEIDRTVAALGPRLTTSLGGIASAQNGVIKQALASISSGRNFNLIDRMFGNTAEATRRATAAIEPITHAVSQLVATGSDFLPRLGDAITDVAQRFDNFISKNEANGNLWRWIDEGLNAARALGNTILNVGKIIAGLTGAAGGDGGMLGGLERFTDKWADFVNSPAGQKTLSEFFAGGREDLKAIWGFLKDIGPVLGDVVEGFSDWGRIMGPIIGVLGDLIGLLDKIPGGLEALVVGFLAFKTLSPFTGLLSGLTVLGGRVDATTARVGGLRGAFLNLRGLGLPAGIAGLAAADGMIGANQSGGSNLAGLGINTASGAAIGAAVAGPPGAIVGAIAGLGKSIYDRVRSDIEAGQKQWEDQWAADHANPDRPGNPDDANRITGRDKILQPSLNAPTIPESLLPAIQAGKLPGYSIGPNGEILDSSGRAVPVPERLAPPVKTPPSAPTGPPLPSGPPIAAGAPAAAAALEGVAVKARAAFENTKLLAESVRTLPSGEVVLKDPTPELIKHVEDLGYKVTNLPSGELQISVVYMHNGSPITRDQLLAPVRVPAVPGDTYRGPGRSTGGVLPGFSRRDNMLVPLAGGEGIIIPEAMRALGSDWLYNLNSSYRPGISRQGYQDGGVHTGSGALPGPVTDDTTALLKEIRDLLAGKGPANPLAMSATGIDQLSKAVGRAEMPGTTMGPFGTPIKPRNRGYEMAAAALQALGADPEKWIGMDPIAYQEQQWSYQQQDLQDRLQRLQQSAIDSAQARAAAPSLTAVPGGLNWDALAQAESGGDWGINTGNGYFGGLQFDQETWDAYKPAGAPARADMATKEQQIAAAQNAMKDRGGPQTLWPQTYGQLATPGPGITVQQAPSSSRRGGVNAPDSGLVPAAAALNDLIMQAFPQITDIGGYRQDPHPDHPSGRALDIMIPGGTVRGGANPSGEMLGDQLWDWLMSTGIVDPNGSLWKTDTGGDHYNHIHARIAEGMENAAVQAGLIPGQGAYTATPGLGGGAGGATPVYVTNWPGQGGVGMPTGPGMPPGVDQILGGVTGGVNAAAQNVIGDVIGAIPATPFTAGAYRGPNAGLKQLVDEGNPLAVAAALGLNVEDFTRFGGVGATNVERGGGYDASGRLYSDTGALLDRTMTSLNAQLQAMRDQLVDVIEQTNQKLQEDAIEPVVKSGVQSALEGLKEAVSKQIGAAMGNAAAAPIADAVASSVAQLPIDVSGANGENITGAMFATGGGVVGAGTATSDSILARLSNGEYVVNAANVRRAGGFAGVKAWEDSLPGYASGGAVNDVVGAEFFGVSEIPIIGLIVNTLISVLLKVLGIEIQARDTMLQMSDDFRSFRGDAFKAFDAQGRLMSDTSAMLDRSSTSEEVAAAERIRILKIVIEGLIKYIIEKVIVPIAKAVANTAIQAGAGAAGSAAGAAINTQAPGAGNLVGGLITSAISSAGTATVDIVAEVGTDLALAVVDVAGDVIAEGLQSLLPDLMTSIFGGNVLAALFDPIGGLLGTLIGGLLGGVGGLFGGVVGGGASTVIPGVPFDEGGIAKGEGYLPKATMADELVLSPVETDLFTRFVRAMENDGFGRSNRTEIHAPITVNGGDRETAAQIEDRLLKLMP